jgi:hypothetical protein
MESKQSLITGNREAAYYIHVTVSQANFVTNVCEIDSVMTVPGMAMLVVPYKFCD